MDFRSGIGQSSTPSYTWLNKEYKYFEWVKSKYIKIYFLNIDFNNLFMVFLYVQLLIIFINII